MPRDAITHTTPVVVTSFAYCEDGQPIDGRIYYIIIRDGSINWNGGENWKFENTLFLREAYRPLRAQAWSTKLAKAVLFNTPKSATDFASKHFMNIREDYETTV